MNHSKGEDETEDSLAIKAVELVYSLPVWAYSEEAKSIMWYRALTWISWFREYQLWNMHNSSVQSLNEDLRKERKRTWEAWAIASEQKDRADRAEVELFDLLNELG